ncbi:MAG TPA: DNA/RNA non-specific endonuclease, partial [Thermoanaerobaculia bacterium]
TPIVELPPAVLSSDPRHNGSNAPRDANITVTFTEPVEVENGWFAISCVSSGQHNSATIAPGGPNAWIIIPNVNFVPGEQCSVTIVKDFVRDTDLDDGGTNTDLLTRNYTATFTVATGDAPAYSSDVHTMFGNPTDATADVNTPNNYLMEKPEFTLSYNRERGTPNWVSWHLADEWIGTLARFDTFRADPAVPADWYRVTHVDYAASGFDRGHMVPNADRDPASSSPINQATFLMTNMIPQAPDNNQGPWANMENYLRTLLPANEVYIVAGGSGTGGSGSNGFTTTIAGGHVTVPAVTWKVALVIPKQDGNDVRRVTAGTRTIAVIMPNVQGIRNNDWMGYLTSVDQVEALTGYDFFEEVADAVENAIEAGVNGTNPPGVENSAIGVDEDAAKTFTLAAVNGSDNPLTYTILTEPAHGTLSGSGANQTYTPLPDFNGTDSFTYRASDGSKSSNTATVSITVYEVNDAPNASSDHRAATEDTPLQFTASELTANDNAGPSNESNQTLTVSGVTATAETHGAVALANGVVTYTPASNYNGAASFAYEVCDDDGACATSSVTLEVAAVNDAPTASISAPATGVEGASVSATITAEDLDADALTIAWTVTKNGAPFANGNGGNVSFTPDDNGVYEIAATAADASAATGTAAVSVAITNAAPLIVTTTGPTGSLVAGTSTTVSVNTTDAGTADTHSATFAWGDGTTSTVACAAGTCSASHSYAAAGIYNVAIVVSDDDGATAASSFDNIVVTDANAGSVTGGGWIATPSGKASLNVNAKYQKNATPAGNTHFEVAGVQFKSTAHEWLVVSGNTAVLQGTGTVNGGGTYGFRITITDAATDLFAIRVWNKSTNQPLYETSAPLGGGNLSIQK